MRTNPRLTQILLDCNKLVAEAIGAFRLPDIDVIAERHFSYLWPRWEDRSLLWRQLLQAAESDDPKAMAYFSLRSMQLLATTIVPWQ